MAEGTLLGAVVKRQVVGALLREQEDVAGFQGDERDDHRAQSGRLRERRQRDGQERHGRLPRQGEPDQDRDQRRGRDRRRRRRHVAEQRPGPLGEPGIDPDVSDQIGQGEGHSPEHEQEERPVDLGLERRAVQHLGGDQEAQPGQREPGQVDAVPRLREPGARTARATRVVIRFVTGRWAEPLELGVEERHSDGARPARRQRQVIQSSAAPRLTVSRTRTAWNHASQGSRAPWPRRLAYALRVASEGVMAPFDLVLAGGRLPPAGRRDDVGIPRGDASRRSAPSGISRRAAGSASKGASSSPGSSTPMSTWTRHICSSARRAARARWPRRSGSRPRPSGGSPPTT